jgi:hypothetical protein
MPRIPTHPPIQPNPGPSPRPRRPARSGVVACGTSEQGPGNRFTVFQTFHSPRPAARLWNRGRGLRRPARSGVVAYGTTEQGPGNRFTVSQTFHLPGPAARLWNRGRGWRRLARSGVVAYGTTEQGPGNRFTVFQTFHLPGPAARLWNRGRGWRRPSRLRRVILRSAPMPHQRRRLDQHLRPGAREMGVFADVAAPRPRAGQTLEQPQHVAADGGQRGSARPPRR